MKVDTTILIVDDEPGIRETLQDIFEDMNYRVTTVASGEEAQEQFSQHIFDIIFLDIRLEDSDGLELLRIFKARQPSTIYMMMSGYVTVNYAIQAIQEGADDFFVKPFLFQDVILKVESALEKRRLTRKLQEMEQIINNSPVIVFLWEAVPGRAVSYVSENISLLGYFPEDFYTGKLNYIDIIYCEDRDILPVMIIEGDGSRCEYRVVTADGDIRYVEERSWNRLEPGGGVHYHQGIIRDITDRIDAKQKILQYQNHLEQLVDQKTEALRNTMKMLQHSNKELEQFASIISHDLNAPLRSIKSFIEILQNGLSDRLNPEEQDLMLYVRESSERMGRMIQALFQYAKLGQSQELQSKCDLNLIVQNVLKDLSFTIIERGAIISVDPLPVVMGYELQLNRLFQNLIENGLKYTSENLHPEIKIGYKENSEGIQVSIADNGIGIDTHFKDKIFEIFKQLHHRDVYGGIGLGLASCKRIVLHHQGQIWVESSLGEGATFYFTIPRDR